MKTQKIIKALSLLTLAIVCSANSAFAQYAGVFGYGLELKGTGAGAFNNGQTTLYALNNGGTTRLTPLGSSATLDQSDWNNGSASAPSLDLGTFNTGAGDTLTLLGGSMLTYQGGGATVGIPPGVYLNYAVEPSGGPYGQFQPGIQLFQNEANVAGNTGDYRWSNESQSINLLTGLAAGTYVLESYGYANSTAGAQYANNNNNPQNWGAKFTVVVPEPATLALAGLGLAGLILFRRK